MVNFNFLAEIAKPVKKPLIRPEELRPPPPRPLLPVPEKAPAVDTGIPIPEKWQVSRAWRYPLDSLKVGDSFFEPWGKVSPYTLGNRIRSAVRKALRRHPEWKYSVRMSPDENGFRVWRIE
jgi:hypothetical protein